MDATKCISYLTIESKEEHPPALKEKMGDWIFGCDICQDVCPYNRRAKTTVHKEFYEEKRAGTWIHPEKIDQLASDDEFRTMFQGSPLKRPKRAGLGRNARTVAENRRATQV